ncbi:salivary peroxidase/catechol oxidase-like [Epargyreus clarus]|uniref:salivary peroxidase/catechol oxidase-like n=1 Tax=Epargyreus clarus TaxID=520877 RepID=UPI003C2CCEB8
MLLFGLFGLFFVLGVNSQANNTVVYYDTYTGRFITLEKYREHQKNNNTFWCTGEFLRECDLHEYRRIDGTCNNLKYPTRGSRHTPPYRLLSPEYDRAPEFDPRRAKDGQALPLARLVRTTLLPEGRVPDQHFTQLLSYTLVALSGDVIAIFDTVNYVLWKPYCCAPRGRTDRECVPNAIPEDDPVHQFSGIRCQNMTRPRSFQSAGCVKNDTAPVRLVSSTPAFDLSNIYGNTPSALNTKGRLFEGGLLKFEIENDKIWPPSSRTQANVCLLNERPRETRCHDGPDQGGNGILGTNLFLIWIWRHHNFIATQLAQVNPCWDDEKLFQAARDINIAYMMQIYYYEMLGSLMGHANLVRDGVLSENQGFRYLYNDEAYPQISLEYPFTLRWAHLLQEAKVKMYDAEGYHLKDIKMVNLTLRTGYLVDNLEFITQGAFRQASGKLDYVIDPDISEKSLGPHQRLLDVTTNDLGKNRYFGFAPYVKYKELCFGKSYKRFEDLLDSIDPERVEQLAEVYKHLEDIDLIAGMWMERPIYGGSVPPTFYCIMVDQLLRTIVSDRHWYESPNRPHAFTIEQLLEVRKATIARFLCDVGDSVTEIQPKAFYRAGPHNQMRSCEVIPKMDFRAWKDYNCDSKDQDIYNKNLNLINLNNYKYLSK